MRAMLGHIGWGTITSAVLAAAVEEAARTPVLYSGPPRQYSVGERARRKRSKYMPHQGKQECARRVRQMAAHGGKEG